MSAVEAVNEQVQSVLPQGAPQVQAPEAVSSQPQIPEPPGGRIMDRIAARDVDGMSQDTLDRLAHDSSVKVSEGYRRAAEKELSRFPPQK